MLGAALAGFAALFAVGFSPRETLYWYIFPLFGIGVVYVIQFRADFTADWKAIFGATAVLSFVAQIRGWPFSGHVLWNVIFLGHANTSIGERNAWMTLLVASLIYLVVLKAVFQTKRDLAGAVLSATIGVVTLLVRSLHKP